MDNFSNNYGSFKSHFAKGEFKECNQYLNTCLGIDKKLTLEKLYRTRKFFEGDTLIILLSCPNLSLSLKIFFEICQLNNIEIANSSVFIEGLSKVQLIQGCANFLEKRNAELKHNSAWNIKYANGNESYLETERQNLYFSSAGLEVQELIKKYYSSAIESSNKEFEWNNDMESKLINLLYHLSFQIELKDSLEKFLFFDWTIEINNNRSIRMVPSISKEGLIETDLINSLKTKEVTQTLMEVANQSLLEKYDDMISGKNLEDESKLNCNPEDIEAFAKSFMLDVKADQIVEWESISFTRNYFPGIEDMVEINLNNKESLKVKQIFRIIGHIAALSRESIARIDDTYKKAVFKNSEQFQNSESWKSIEIEALLNKGNNERIKNVLKKNYNEQFYKEQQQVINSSKELISNNNTLMSIDIEEFVKHIQLIRYYPEDLIKKVLDLFTYKGAESDFTRAPFLKIGESLFWLPNMVAYASFSENLMEVLLNKNMINIHLDQTKLFERSINNIFLNCGYKIILTADQNEEKQKKIFRSKENKDLGDFDILAYKNGKLIYMESKLTNTRNSYIERHNWKNTKLKEAIGQIDSGLEYIKTNSDKIKTILDLLPEEEIKEVETYIISNSRLFDGEMFGKHLKINYHDLSMTLMLSKLKEETGNAPLDISTVLKNNLLFQDFTNTIKVTDSTIEYGDFSIVRPGFIPQNIYTAL